MQVARGMNAIENRVNEVVIASTEDEAISSNIRDCFGL